ncbi:glycosyltransferase family 4 protein [Propionibacterium sp.]|uniref:glycosyltransferase family 4 protein n=1 Tax=Propionibacterium sp. TaxID=1977903 RepID=UPI0039EA707E
MRVAIVAECFLPQINGVTNSVLRILESLHANGHQAEVLAPDDPKGVPKDYLGFPVHTAGSVPVPWYTDFRVAMSTVASIERRFTDFAPDVVHLAAPVLLGRNALVAACRLGLPTVALYQTDVPSYAVHYGYGLAEPAVWRHMRRLHEMATLTLAPSSSTRHRLLAHGIPRVDIWGRGVDSGRFQPSRRDEQLHEAWAPNGECVIGYLGRLGAEKRVADLAVLQDIPDTKLVIIGDGPQREELEEQLPGAIFTGAKTGDELPRHLASIDVFVHPGELETFGQTLQEASACALPVIAPRMGGPIDIVQEGRTGHLYTPGDLLDLRDWVSRLAGDPQLRWQMGLAARQAMAPRTWPKLCDQLMGYYTQAIAMTRTATRAVIAA